jgi:glycine cleavage system aminomethyltransferase T
MGLILKEGRLPHGNDKVLKDGEEIGFVTHAVYSPTLSQNIALAYLRRKRIQPDLKVSVMNSLDGSKIPAQVVDLPFYKRSPL